MLDSVCLVRSLPLSLPFSHTHIFTPSLCSLSLPLPLFTLDHALALALPAATAAAAAAVVPIPNRGLEDFVQIWDG